MDFSFFCRGFYDPIKSISSQTDFVIGLFKAAGSSFIFSERNYQSNSNYATKLFNGSKPLSGTQRKTFQNPIDKSGIVRFFHQIINDTCARSIMNYFEIPSDVAVNLDALETSLADQLQIIIHEPDSDEDIVASNYQQYLIEPASVNDSRQRPLYNGDMYWIDNKERYHSVNFYDHFTHTWRIVNKGKIKWKNRRLVCRNDSEITPNAAFLEVEVPETQPNQIAIVSVEFDARGVEKEFTSKWTMVNESGQDCFPGLSGAMNVIIDVRNMGFQKLGGV